jgi:uncharacterized protein (DUF2147 family)
MERVFIKNNLKGTIMKKRFIFAAVFIAAVQLCFAADPAEGYWLSIDDKTGNVTAGWEIYLEGGKLMGKIVSTAEYPQDVLAEKCKQSYRGFPVAGDVSRMRVVGTPWIFGMSSEKTGQWAGGNVVDPSDGGMYRCKLIYHPADGKKFKNDTLEMRGEIGLGIGRSQYWQKADRETAISQRPNS